MTDERQNLGIAVQITYMGNIIRCSRHKTMKENFETAKMALQLVIGHHLTDEIIDDINIAVYRTIAPGCVQD